MKDIYLIYFGQDCLILFANTWTNMKNKYDQKISLFEIYNRTFEQSFNLFGVHLMTWIHNIELLTFERYLFCHFNCDIRQSLYLYGRHLAHISFIVCTQYTYEFARLKKQSKNISRIIFQTCTVMIGK